MPSDLPPWQQRIVDEIYSHPGQQIATPCGFCRGLGGMRIIDPVEDVPCAECGGKGYVINTERVTQFVVNAGRMIGKTQANKKFREICEELGIFIKNCEPVVREFNDQMDSLRYAIAAMEDEKFLRAKDAMNRWMDEMAHMPTEPEYVGRQDYPDDDEVCCLCHEDVGGGYPPEAYERRQAPYTYIEDLQGWAHDPCAKEYFQPQNKVLDLKLSRTERLPWPDKPKP